MAKDSGSSRSSRATILLAIDEICDQFEQAWERGQRPDLLTFVERMPESHRGRLLQDLIPSDIEYCQRAGEQPTREDYIARFPQYTANIDAALASPNLAGSETPNSAEPRPTTAQPSKGPTLDALKEFFTLVVDSGVMSKQDIEKFWKRLPAEKRPENVADLGATLVRAGALTQYQVGRIQNNDLENLVIDDYEVLDEIGAGGMGAVLKARHRRMKRDVALKIINQAALQSPDALERFQQEVQAAARMSHQNIVTAFDAGETDGLHYFVMEYVPGQDLASLIKNQGQLSIDDAVDYILQTAEGLKYAHDNHIVHRDIKPANLLLSSEGIIKILDMGLATLGEVEQGDGTQMERLTQSGQMMGTADYMSPEQALDTRDADARSDIYSLGCTLYRLVTGERMYQGDTMMKVVMAHSGTPIPSMRKARPEVSEQLEAAYQKMVAKEPGERQQSMGEVIEQLRACQVGDDAAGTPSEIGRRKPPAAQPAQARETEEASASQVEPTAPFPVDESADGDLASVDSGSGGGVNEFTINTSPGAVAQAIKKAKKSASTEETIVGQATDDTVKSVSPLVKLTKPPYRIYTIVATSTLGFLALLAATIFFLQTPNGTLRVEINDPSIVVKVKGSDIVLRHADKDVITLQAGEHSLVVTRGDFTFETKQFVLKKGETTIVKVDLLPGKVQVVSAGNVIGSQALDGSVPPATAAKLKHHSTISMDDHACFCAAFSPDSNTIAVGFANGELGLWDVESRRLMRKLTAHKAWIGNIDFAPNGKSFVTCSKDKSTKVWSTKDLNLKWEEDHGSDWAYCAKFASSGDLYSSHARQIDLWSGGKLKNTYRLNGYCAWFDISPNEDRLVTSEHIPHRYYELDVLTGRRLRSLTTHKLADATVVFSSDGQVIVGSEMIDDEPTLTIWSNGQGSPKKHLHGHSMWVTAMCLAKNGNRLFTADESGVIKMWDVNSGKVLDSVVAHTDKIGQLKLSENDRLLVSTSHDGTAKLWTFSDRPRKKERPDHVPLDAVIFNGRWYKLFNKPKTWINAHRQCIHEAGYLAKIESKTASDQTYPASESASSSCSGPRTSRRLLPGSPVSC